MKKTQIITEFGVVYISLLVQNINIFWLNNYAAIKKLKKKSALWQNKHEDFQKKFAINKKKKLSLQKKRTFFFLFYQIEKKTPN